MQQKLYVSKDLVFQDANLTEALNIFKWQLTSDDEVSKSESSEATYIICSYHSYKTIFESSRSVNKRYYIIFDNDNQFLNALKELNPTQPYKWEWKNQETGYEVTSKGDRRYSPFYMKMDDPKGRSQITLEDYYQLYIKGYIDKGYTHGYEVKGLPPLRPELLPGSAHRLFGDYLFEHKGLFYELAVIGMKYSFTDMFDKEGGQNKTYADLLNRYFGLI